MYAPIHCGNMTKYQEIYPSEPLLASQQIKEVSKQSDLLTLEYFEAEPGSMPIQVFEQHHILVNLNPNPHRVENWRESKHNDYTLLENEIVVTPAGMKNGWRWYAKSKVIIITLNPELFSEFAQNELGVILSSEQLKDVPKFLDADLTLAASSLYMSLEERSLGFEVMYESLARVFLVKLIQKYAEFEANEHNSLSANRFNKVFAYVKAHFHESLGLEDLASVVAISPHHFSRIFKKTVGKSPMHYLQAYRVEQAKKMLRNENHTLLDIATQCGFSDQAHFSRLFKQYTDVTPKQYRKSQVNQ